MKRFDMAMSMGVGMFALMVHDCTLSENDYIEKKVWDL